MVGIETKENFLSLQGLSLKNIRLTALYGKKILFSDIGEMLFTHFGVSGPLALSVSSLINRKNPEDVRLSLDLKPGLTDDQLKNRIERDFAEMKGKNAANALVKLMPARLIGAVLGAAGIDARKKTADFSKTDMLELINAVKRFSDFRKGLASRCGGSRYFGRRLREGRQSENHGKQAGERAFFSGEVLV